MPKFTFICEDDPMPFSESIVTKRTVEFDAVQINDVVAEFELFLRGAGFNPSGTLDFVQDDVYYNSDIDFSEPDCDITLVGVVDDLPEFPITDKSPCYFDTERNK